MLQVVTGWDVTIEELLTVGERRLNMMRSFNARGIDRNQDALSEKFFQKSLQGGPSDGWKVDKAEWEAARDEYYRQSGWDVRSGTPPRHTLWKGCLSDVWLRSLDGDQAVDFPYYGTASEGGGTGGQR